MVLSLSGCCSLFTVWFPFSWGTCTSGLRCLRCKLAAKLVQSRLPFVVSPPSDVSISPSPALAGLVLCSQSFGPSCCSCVLSSRGVSGAAFGSLGLLSLPLLLLFLAWVSSFGVCSDWGWKAEVLSWFLPSFGGGSPSLVLVVCPSSLSFLDLFAGVLSSRLQCLLLARGGCRIVLGYLPSMAWRCYPGFLSGACRLALVGLRCLWVLHSCGVHGLRDGVTFLWSGLCSSSVRDRNDDFPSFWWVWFLAFVRGPLPQVGAVFFDLR